MRNVPPLTRRSNVPPYGMRRLCGLLEVGSVSAHQSDVTITRSAPLSCGSRGCGAHGYTSTAVPSRRALPNSLGVHLLSRPAPREQAAAGAEAAAAPGAAHAA